MKFVDGDAGALRKLALRFALSEPTVSTLVVGMKSIEEVEENVEACNQGPLSSEEHQELTKILQATPHVSWKDS